eukprot:CAMPEP_0172083616 /NCGR_PEP_ID=MMETSP1043-20130122/20536_1 /TAXON_ID=464988 /ORGANISM="Hemiselmis andersenii, Strain CCMP441" /LENGTH=68 /DNA_ID=CAMNT_0012745347 /DNA_START=200 /DNA_END=407 /DNA_ORIENTATION=+
MTRQQHVGRLYVAVLDPVVEQEGEGEEDLPHHDDTTFSLALPEFLMAVLREPASHSSSTMYIMSSSLG